MSEIKRIGLLLRILMWVLFTTIFIVSSCVAVGTIKDIRYESRIIFPHVPLPVDSVFDLKRFGKAEHFLMVFDYEFPAGTSIANITGYFSEPGHADKILTLLEPDGNRRLEIDENVIYDERNTGHWHIMIDVDAEGRIAGRDASLDWVKGWGRLKEPRAFYFEKYNPTFYFGTADANKAREYLRERLGNDAHLSDFQILMIIAGGLPPVS